MLKYNFFDKKYSNCTKEEMLAFMKKTDKPFVYTYGLEYRNPTTHRKPVTKEEAVRIFEKGCCVDATEEEACIHVNEFGEMDMW